MPGTAAKIKEVTLAPGEFYFGQGNTRIHTLLGSCVAITIWHPTRFLGGMCHYLLPQRGVNRKLSDGYFADDAVRLFCQAVIRTKTRPADYEVKVFGGGNMFSKLAKPASLLNVSQSNIKAGLDLLVLHGFKLKSSDVGGVLHRKIFLELWNGDVWVQRGNVDK